jgi:outer membrane receptor for Fe3+-dicitrate
MIVTILLLGGAALAEGQETFQLRHAQAPKSESERSPGVAPPPSSSEEATVLAPVVVTAPPPVSSSSELLIPGRDFELRPQGRPADVLRYVPGLVLGQHAGGGKSEQYILRGFDADHGTDVALFVDGLPINLRSHAHGQGYADQHTTSSPSSRDRTSSTRCRRTSSRRRAAAGEPSAT